MIAQLTKIMNGCTGKKYFYYHCNHCKKERFSAKKVNTVFESILDDFQFTKQSKILYKEILKSLSGTNQKNILRKRNKLEKELASKEKIAVDSSKPRSIFF